jgi:hypothetical protein
MDDVGGKKKTLGCDMEKAAWLIKLYSQLALGDNVNGDSIGSKWC